MYVGVSLVELKTEADSNDNAESSHDDIPSTGTFAVSDVMFSAFVCQYWVYLYPMNHKKIAPKLFL